MPRKETNKLIIGSIIGNLTILATGRYALCKCRCGNIKQIRRDHLKNFKITSCGCLRNKKSRERVKNLHATNTTHSMSKTPIYGIWNGIKQRCYNEKNPSYSYYGGRGIKLCERWHDFANFLADLGKPEPGMTLDRINTNGNYEPSNCRWATRKEQMFNTRRNKIIEYKGVALTITEWAIKLGISRNTFNERLRTGWTIQQAIETPVLRKRRAT